MDTKEIVLLIGVLFIGFLALNPSQQWIPDKAPAGTQVTQVPGTTSCGQTSVTMTHGAYQYLGTAGALTTANGVVWYKNGQQQSAAVTMGATNTVAPGDKIIEIAGSPISMGASSNTYGKKYEITAPCGSFSVTEQAAKDGVADANLLMRNATGTTATAGLLRCSNSVTNNVNDQALENETINTGGQGKFDCKIETNQYYGMSPYGKIVAVIEINKTAYDTAQFTWGTAARGTVPNAYVPQQPGLVSERIAFELTGCPTAGKTLCDDSTGLLYVAARAGANPGAESSVNVTLYDQEWDTNSIDNSKILFGVEDNVAAVSGHGPSKYNLGVL